MNEPTTHHEGAAKSSAVPSAGPDVPSLGLLRRDPFEVVAESFLARYGAGERPSIEEYAARYPEIADQIRELLPALLILEQDPSIDPQAAASDATRSEMRQLGDYLIIRQIGRGGMGVVYEAEQVSLGRRVALKVLPAHVAHDGKALERFRREAKAAARLHHTNIVPVFEVGRSDGVAYFAMQFIQGQSLDQVIGELARFRGQDQRQEATSRAANAVTEASEPREPVLGRVAESLLKGRLATEGAAIDVFASSDSTGSAATDLETADATSALPPPEGAAGHAPAVATIGQPASTVLPGGAEVSTTVLSGRRPLYFQSVARIGRQAAQGLAYAHARGVIHRDIKPSNLLLDHAGVVWIADFGLAKADEDGLTATGDVLGTLRYMAPERFRNEGDGRVDIYALGLTLYELLTLTPAFQSSDRLRLIERIKSEEPVGPRSLDARIPRDLETIVLKAIEKDPRRRYATADALAEDLRRFLDDEPIMARQASAVERYVRWARRNPGIAVLGAVLTAVLVAGVIVSSYFALRAKRGEELARRNEDVANQNAQRADEQASRARSEARLSDLRLYLAHMSLASQAIQEGQTDLAEQYIAEYGTPRSTGEDWRGFEWYYLHRICQFESLTMRGHTSNVMGVAFSPDGRTIASASEDHTARIWDAGTGQELRAFRGHTSNVLDLAVSPDGRRIASVGMDRVVRVWDAATTRDVLALSGHQGMIMGVAFSQDGHTIASCGDDRVIKLWDALTGRELRTLSGHTDAVWDVAFSPDGRRLVSASADYSVRLWEADTGRLLRTLSGHRGPVWGVAYSPDGHMIASASSDETVKLWDVVTGRNTLTLRGHSARVMNVTFSPDGRTLASTSVDRAVKLWDVATGRNLLTQRQHTDLVWGVAFSPDGRALATASNDRTVRVWYTDSGQGVESLRGHGAGVLALAYSPDGKLVASSGSDRTIRLWDTDTGLDRLTLYGHTAEVRCVAFRPDGRRLASGSGSPDRTVRLWDTATGRELLALRGHEQGIRGVAFHPGGELVASGSSDGTVRLWDTESGRELRVFSGHASYVNAVAFSPDGRIIASGSDDRTVRLWDAKTGRALGTLVGHTQAVRSVVFSPDGTTVASAGSDRTVRVWSPMTGQCLSIIRGHASAIYGMAFSPDGRRLATANGDTSIRLWDFPTGQKVLDLHGHTDQVAAVAFRPDSLALATAGADRAVQIWDATPTTPELRAKRQAREVVESLYARSLNLKEVREQIGKATVLGPDVRRLALDLAEPHGESRVAHEAQRVVEALYDKTMLRPEVIAFLRTDFSLSEPVRRKALTLAGLIPENPARLNGASWATVIHPGSNPAAYLLALRQAETACRLVPGNVELLVTLGVAQYRMGQYRDAVATLSEAQRLDPLSQNIPGAADLAFLALCHHRLGQENEALAFLNRLRSALKSPAYARSELGRLFLREAETLELDLAFPPDPFAGPE